MCSVGTANSAFGSSGNATCLLLSSLGKRFANYRVYRFGVARSRYGGIWPHRKTTHFASFFRRGRECFGTKDNPCLYAIVLPRSADSFRAHVLCRSFGTDVRKLYRLLCSHTFSGIEVLLSFRSMFCILQFISVALDCVWRQSGRGSAPSHASSSIGENASVEVRDGQTKIRHGRQIHLGHCGPEGFDARRRDAIMTDIMYSMDLCIVFPSAHFIDRNLDQSCVLFGSRARGSCVSFLHVESHVVLCLHPVWSRIFSLFRCMHILPRARDGGR